ncbi:hypothetical protein GE061_008013 [Apolygus lucorum]|uniref:Piwi domain-containing protein n=1 Tax=Apolygus lucorum TaxID=248454 RepID=A0A8S9WR43_APOLU|nr:hypothetical protein GE061_008013 [Apolygus lucorum]
MKITGSNGARGSRGDGPSAPTGRPRSDVPPPSVVKTRPDRINSKKGEAGQKVMLQANYFNLNTRPDWSLYQYRVDFAPEEDRTAVKKRLLRCHEQTIGSGYIFDGTVLFVVTRLHPEPLVLHTKNEAGDENVRITIKQAGDLVMGDHNYLQLFNIVMRKCLDGLQLQLVGRDFFDALQKVEIRDFNLELWPGYLTSIRQHENSILMCAEISHKVMRRDTALDFLHTCQNKCRSDWRAIFEEGIIGYVVLTGYNNRTYRVDDVDYNVTPLSEFQLKGLERTSYVDYYKKKYGIRIVDVHQPLLVSKSKPREIRAGMTDIVYLIPELCRMTGFTDEMRSNFHLMRALAEHTRMPPNVRIDRLMRFNSRLQNTPSVQKDLANWKMTLDTRLITFPGRILDQEEIHFSRTIRVRAGNDADWTRNMRSNPMFDMGSLKSWVVIYMDRMRADVHNFISILQKSGGTLKFYLPPPVYEEVRDDRMATYVSALEKVISTRNPQLIMCIVPNNRSDRYSAIKKKCCVDRAVPTQVVVQKNLNSKGVMSIATKIAIQMNCKIGGTPWSIPVPMQGLMICGYDVCHDTTTKGRSFGAMVASINSVFSRYFSAVTPHTNGEELSNDLSMNVVKAVVRYSECNNGSRPKTIIIYRDGVGEGQIPFVYKHEVKLIKEKLRELYSGEMPLFAFVIVTKRLNTRLFYQGKNPPPGTIADDCITSPDRYDFFLVSQSVQQGTVSPTSYNVIEDSTRLAPDRMQRLSYKMTHLYYNWSGTVRVPAQCQYAHKLAFLVGQSLHKTPNAGLDDLLYYL